LGRGNLINGERGLGRGNLVHGERRLGRGNLVNRESPLGGGNLANGENRSGGSKLAGGDGRQPRYWKIGGLRRDQLGRSLQRTYSGHTRCRRNSVRRSGDRRQIPDIRSRLGRKRRQHSRLRCQVGFPMWRIAVRRSRVGDGIGVVLCGWVARVGGALNRRRKQPRPDATGAPPRWPGDRQARRRRGSLHRRGQTGDDPARFGRPDAMPERLQVRRITP
jgi:hypothetical protein